MEEEKTTQQPQRTDALACFSPEELRCFWDEIGRACRFITLSATVLEAVDDELASLPLDAAGEDGAVAAAHLVQDATGYVDQARGILSALIETWKE